MAKSAEQPSPTIHTADTPMANAFRDIAGNHAESARQDALHVALDHYDLIAKGLAAADDQGVVPDGTFSEEEWAEFDALVEQYAEERPEVIGGAGDLVETISKSEAKNTKRSAKLNDVRTKISRAKRLGVDQSEIDELEKREQKLVAKIDTQKAKEENKISKVHAQIQKEASDKVFHRAENIDPFEFWGFKQREERRKRAPEAPVENPTPTDAEDTSAVVDRSSLTNDVDERPPVIEDDGSAVTGAKPGRAARRQTLGANDETESAVPAPEISEPEQRIYALLDEVRGDGRGSLESQFALEEARAILADPANGFNSEDRADLESMINEAEAAFNGSQQNDQAPRLVGEPEEPVAPRFVHGGADVANPEPLPEGGSDLTSDDLDPDEQPKWRGKADSDPWAQDDEWEVPSFLRGPAGPVDPFDAEPAEPVVEDDDDFAARVRGADHGVPEPGEVIDLDSEEEVPAAAPATAERPADPADDPHLSPGLRNRLRTVQVASPDEAGPQPVAAAATSTEARPTNAEQQQKQKRDGRLRKFGRAITARVPNLLNPSLAVQPEPRIGRGPQPTPRPGQPNRPVRPVTTTAATEARPPGPLRLVPRVRVAAEPAEPAEPAERPAVAEPVAAPLAEAVDVEPIIDGASEAEKASIRALQRQIINGGQDGTIPRGSSRFTELNQDLRAQLGQAFPEEADFRAALQRTLKGQDPFGEDEE